jgi:hypothetical protein
MSGWLDEAWAVRFNRDRHSLRQRFIALAAAYVIALSSLVASFVAARAAAGDAAHPGGVICHTEHLGQTAPFPGDTNSKLCVDRCGAGCVMLLAALPPPPVTAVAMPRAASEAVHRFASAVFVRALATNAHRSRAPPLPL